MTKILTDHAVEEALENSQNTVIAYSISGGKDSSVLALETDAHLDAIGFTGTRVAVHSDLGLIEHHQSGEMCRRLADHLNIPLHVVKPKRPMIKRWEYRWECVSRRFVDLETVRISTPWSSAASRFCTSESKTAPISRYLKNLFPGKTILNVIGLRRQESSGRAKKPITQKNDLLRMKRLGTKGLTWMPILAYSLEDVFLAHRRHGFALHEAYTKFGLSRVSCSFCVLAGEDDLRASLSDERNHPAFVRLAQLEINSTFSFKPDLWLADLAPCLLTENEREGLKNAKARAVERRLADRQIPVELLFDKDTGFPAFQPTIEQSKALGEARARIGEILHLPVKYTTAGDVYDRYAELLVLKAEKEARQRKKNKKNAPSVAVQGSLF